jgi:hypothetical protein
VGTFLPSTCNLLMCKLTPVLYSYVQIESNAIGHIDGVMVSFYLMKFWRSDIPIYLFIFLIFLLRISLYGDNYPNLNTLDPSLEYLVASHMIKYQEFPLVGTTAFDGKATVNSPLYYYFIAVFLLIFRSVFTLYALNIVLQSAMTVIIYHTVKRLFGKSAAIIAALFRALSMWSMETSQFFFQPYIMQPFFFASIYSIIRSYTERSFRWLIASILCMHAATGFYLSSLPYIPLYLGALFMTLQRLPHKYKHRLTLFFLIMGFIACFGTVINLTMSRQTLTLLPEQALTVSSPTRYIEKFIQFFQLHQHLTSPFQNSLFREMLPRYPAWWIPFFLGIVMLLTRRSRFEKISVIFLWIAIGIPIAITPLFKTPVSDWYLHLSMGFTMIYIAMVLGKTFFSHPHGYSAGILTTATLLIFSANGFQFQVPQHYQTAISGASAVQKEIENIHPTDSDVNFSFIQFMVWERDQKFRYTNNPDYLFWHLLEKQTKKKYLSINTEIGLPNIPSNTPYVFLTCTGTSEKTIKEAQKTCVSLFTKEHAYDLSHQVFSDGPFDIYLMKQKNTL